MNKTMGKIRETKQKPARPVRTVLIAAAVAALLCGSAFAAHSFGWFDRLLFDASYHGQNADLFEIPVPEQMEQELVIELDDPYWKTATITPISFRLDGTSSPQSSDSVTITLKDGTSFDLASVENGYAYSDYGTYGSMSSSGIGMTEEDRTKKTWLFSQLIDLDELASITVCGVTYPVSP